jgi:SAM-dependent methyltransferase
MQQSAPRSFNDDKHGRGEWDTAMLTYKNGPLRAAAGYCSAKRRGITQLADSLPGIRMVMDAGAGNGAYSIWFIARKPCTIVSVDVSIAGLRKISSAHGRSGTGGRVLPVCADVTSLPFKENIFGAIFSIDTLGHVADINSALNEFARICSPNASLFLHSECADYRSRWPDNALIARLGRDVPAMVDGHDHLRLSRDLYSLYSQRFHLVSFVNPAGYFGWFLGYPEKYLPAFTEAGWKFLRTVALVFAACKRTPIIGPAIRIVNAFTNHAEVYFGLTGGGSCFAFLKKP